MNQHDRIAKVIEEYDAQGIHRTATLVDEQSAHWLADQVRAIGLEPVLEGYEINRLDPGDCYLEVAGRRIDGVPLFDSTHTDASGVRGRLALPEASGDGRAPIRLLEGGHRTATVREAREANAASALVVLTTGHGATNFSSGSKPGLALLNAFDFDAPFGPPALQVSSTEGDWLRAQAEAGEEIAVVAHAERTRATAYNVTTELAGADPSLMPLAVNTPRSGWWEIAAERGGGIACWLEVMRSVVESGSPRRVFFSANTGHELGFSGTDAILDNHPELTTGATWLHFGANIGSASGNQGNLAASTEALRAVAEPEYAQVDRPMRHVIGEAGGGEMATIHRRGGRQYLALTNDNALFHMREDRYPDNVDVDLVTQFAAASQRIAQSLAAHLPADVDA